MKTDTVFEKPGAVKTALPPETITAQPSTAYRGLRKQFIAVVSAQLLLLLGLAAPKAYTLCHGQTISTQALIYDPSDPFRGEYENLTLTNISQVHTNLHLVPNEAVYVKLSQSANGQWAAVAVAKEKPVLKAGEVTLKATTTSVNDMGNKGEVVTVAYGFEHFYVPQGKSTNLRLKDDPHLMTQIAVDSSGEACLKQVIFRGHKIFDATDWLHPYAAELL